MLSQDVPRWPFPFAEEGGASLSRWQWLALIAIFVALHFLSLGAAWVSGTFDPLPNHDHVHIMRQVLAVGYPRLAIWPPGFGYYMALKWWLTKTLGLPYWSGKLLIDWIPVVLSGVLSTLLGLRLTRNRFLGVAAGLGLVAAPIFALASADGLAVVLFEPFFLGALILLSLALQEADSRLSRSLLGKMIGAGLLLGAACLVRANPEFLLLFLAPIVIWIGRRSAQGPWARYLALALAAALAAQLLVLLPWSVLERRLGRSGVFAAPVVYYAYFDGMRRHPGYRVSDALRGQNPPPPLNMHGVVDFNLRWLARDPVGLAELYAVKSVRTWYLSDSGRWDRWILGLHAPWLLLALVGVAVWWRRARGDPALWFVLLVIVYMWLVAAVVSDLARYMAPVYGLLGLLAGVGILGLSGRAKSDPRGETSS